MTADLRVDNAPGAASFIRYSVTGGHTWLRVDLRTGETTDDTEYVAQNRVGVSFSPLYAEVTSGDAFETARTNHENWPFWKSAGKSPERARESAA